MFLVLWIINVFIPEFPPALIALACQVVLSLGWCVLARKWYLRRFKARPTAIIYDVRTGL